MKKSASDDGMRYETRKKNGWRSHENKNKQPDHKKNVDVISRVRTSMRVYNLEQGEKTKEGWAQKLYPLAVMTTTIRHTLTKAENKEMVMKAR